MGSNKVSIFIYVTIAALLLLLISHHSPNTSRPSRRHRRLKLRSNFTTASASAATTASQNHHPTIPFDPLLADIERQREDKEWEKTHHVVPGESDHHAPGMEGQPEWEDFMDAEDYINDEDKFNVTNRLLLLFPRIDVAPADGYVSLEELTEWNLKQAEKEVLHRSQRELELHDKNGDGVVSFEEYHPPNWAKVSDMGWWKEEHFKASDADGDGVLNITEFNDFQHPADSKNPRLLQWLCKEEVRERDSDKDGKVSFPEFFHGLFDLVRNYDEEEHNSSGVSHDTSETPARKLFAQLDKDGDGYLSDLELLPVIGKLHPSERYYAKQQADYIVTQADADKDGRLSLSEMVDNPYVFYSAIFADDEDEDYSYHDEFR